MKTFVLAAGALLLFVSDASAISRYQTMQMDCRSVQSAVRQEGAAILRWQSTRNPGLPLYGRYVRDSRFCSAGEVSEFATVPTADRRACPVKKCVMAEPLFGRRGPRLLLPN